MIRRRTAGILAFLALFSAAAFPLELEEGRIRLVLHERTGRFSLSYLRDVGGRVYQSLFLDVDPRTSLLSIACDDRIFRMGEAPGFPFTTERTEEGAAFVWKSPALEVRQDFGFVTSKDAAQPDGIRIKLTIKNTGEKDCRIGVRYLIDTHLGEPSGKHFSTPLKDRFGTEASIRPSEAENHFRSRDTEDAAGVGLQVMLTGEGITPAAEAVFANWKRLSETPWSYAVNPNRNHNLLPYSINDSAACVYYPAETLKSGGTREILTVMGNVSGGEYRAGPGAGFSDFLTRITGDRDGKSVSDPSEAMKAELAKLEDLLRRLDARMNSNDPLSGDEIMTLEKILEELKRSKSKHE